MFILVLNQLIKMLLIILLAFFCFRKGVIDQNGNKTVSNLLLTVVNPILIITVYQTDYDADLVHGLLISFVCGAAAHIIGIVIAALFIPRKNNPEYAIERFASVYSNCGFIGIPLIASILGDTGVFYLTAYMTVFNLFSWTHGLVLLKQSFSWKQMREGLLSPIFLATCAAMVLFFARIRIPELVLDSMDYVASMNTPLAMMVAGFSVAQADLKKIFTNLAVYRAAALKLIAVPLAVLAFLLLLRVDHTVLYTVLTAAACPTATTLTMMAMRYEKNYTYGSEIFAFTTVLSVVTIPVVIYMAEFILG